MYEYDMQLLKTVLKEVKKHRIDAVIASDFAVIDYCNKMEIPLHISPRPISVMWNRYVFFPGMPM